MFSISFLNRISKSMGKGVSLYRLYSKHIRVPPECIQLSFVRSPGPGKAQLVVLTLGGQNVNKVNTKVEARFNVQAATWLPQYFQNVTVIA